MAIEIRTIRAGEADAVVAAGDLFDLPPTAAGATAFLDRPGHHLLMAFDGERGVGFVSCVEMAHPDKGIELFLYELGVDEGHRRQGIARQLVQAALDLAEAQGCYGAWTITEDDNAAALATYRAAGAEPDSTSVTQTWNWRDD